MDQSSEGTRGSCKQPPLKSQVSSAWSCQNTSFGAEVSPAMYRLLSIPGGNLGSKPAKLFLNMVASGEGKGADWCQMLRHFGDRTEFAEILLPGSTATGALMQQFPLQFLRIWCCSMALRATIVDGHPRQGAISSHVRALRH